jgi:hypothetical protein
MRDLDARLGQARRTLERIDPPPDLWDRIVERANDGVRTLELPTVDQRPKRRALVLAGAALVAIVALVAALAQREAGRTVQTVPADGGNRVAAVPSTTTSVVPAPAATTERVPDGWQTIAASPLSGRSPATSVWTGDELIVWRGRRMPGAGCEQRSIKYCNEPPLTDAAAYRPSTDTWRVLPPPPSGFESLVAGDVAVWTGNEMIVWGHGTAAAAYDPKTNRWRRIADAPIPIESDPSTATWTGRQVIVVVYDGVAAYDPAKDKWSRLPSLEQRRWGHSAVWTDAGLVVFGGWTGPGAPAADSIELLAPGAKQWQTIGATPQLLEAATAWTGHLIVVAGRTDFDHFTVATIDPGTGAWATIAPPPLERLIDAALVWTGTEAVLIGNGRRSPSIPDQRLAVGWNPSTGVWRVLPEAPELTARSGAAATWTGSGVLVWGGFVSDGFGVGQPFADGGTYTPPTS